MGKTIYLSNNQLGLICDCLVFVKEECYYDDEEWIQEADEIISKLLPKGFIVKDYRRVWLELQKEGSS